MVTQEQLKEYFHYSDGTLIWKKTISKNTERLIGKVAGSITDSGYWCVVLERKKYYAHRLIFLYHHGYIPDCIDHINGNKTDNRIENLRESTQQQNCFNANKKSTNTSGVKGISWHKQSKKWRAECCVNYKNHYLGLYDDMSEAISVLEKFRNSSHGEFAKH